MKALSLSAKFYLIFLYIANNNYPESVSSTVPNMILYNTTYNISSLAEQDWLAWMKTVQVPAMMATGLPTEHKMLRLLTELENEGVTFSVQYSFRTMEDYLAYQTQHQADLYQRHHDRYKEQYVSFRTLLEEI